MSTQDRRTPEQHHTALIAAINYELDTYGPASLAEVIASVIDDRIGDDDDPDSNYHRPEGARWREARRAFEDVAASLPSRPRVVAPAPATEED